MNSRASLPRSAPSPESRLAEPLCPAWVRRDLARWAPALSHAVSDIPLPKASALDPGDAPYARKVLHRSTAGELMMARWRHGAQCAIHDHGGGHGRVYILCGGVHEQRWTDEAAVRDGRLPTTRELGPGESLQVDPATFHAMRSHAGLATLTLHAYVGATHPVRIPLPQRRTTLAVPPDHGAWLPLPEVVLKEEAWPSS